MHWQQRALHFDSPALNLYSALVLGLTVTKTVLFNYLHHVNLKAFVAGRTQQQFPAVANARTLGEIILQHYEPKGNSSS